MSISLEEQIGRRLRRRRRVLELTQVELAARTGLRFQQIHKYEVGANALMASRLWALAEALETPVEYFFDGLSHDARYGCSQPETESDRPAERRPHEDPLELFLSLGRERCALLLEKARHLMQDDVESCIASPGDGQGCTAGATLAVSSAA